ncbi:hypothetical protein [Kitasatospora terrestris]
MALPVPPGATAGKQPTDRPKNRTGVLNLDQYVAANYDPQWAETATRAAKERGFVTAACRAWKNPDGSQSQMMLVQYASATGAQAHYRGLHGLWTEDTSTTFFDDPDDQAAGLLHTKPIMDGMTYASLLTTRGNILVYVTHFTPKTPDRDTAQDLFHRQLSALAG